MLGAAGCGDDDEEPAATATETVPAETTPSTETAPTDTVTVPDEERPEVPPEEQPGGAGDEEEIRSEAKLVARGSRIQPAKVFVPAFIGVRVELRSLDGGRFGLACGDKRVQVDREIPTASTTIDGRRTGVKVVCRPLFRHNPVLISFSAEPGP